ncbi:tetratricopeptide repeat protein [Clostridium estertheticum]|uniref:tetratricopeptide repeat protein n=1 Tax=Clostridium estertheticum TaxID=238834 RepID=UPI001CF3D688|nr:hypothetical protein [Clostridium estertheticum]MCB2353755.1 hypothetical protein [Clostridium estertheticum]WAG40543.1 hypothetical protein LL065_20170 [Clostridium estertheticum]
MEKVKVKSFKIKLIIFTVICAMEAGIVVNAKIKNSNVIEINDKNRMENLQLQECEIKNQAELEKRWKIGYDQFFEGEYAKAIATENQVLKEDSKFYKAYAVKGIALAYNGDFKGGMRQIDNSLKLKPDYGYARFNKALAYELYGYYAEAIKWYERDLKVEKSEWTYYGIASIYGRKGDINNTVKYLKLAIAINPNIKNKAKNEKDFENVKKYNQFKFLIEK